MQDSGHTPEWTGKAVERLMRNGKRIFTSEFKAWLVEQAGKSGTSVAGLAMRYGVNANQLRRWMRLAEQHGQEQRGPFLLPVYVEQSQVPVEPTMAAVSVSATSATSAAVVSATPPIEIEVAGAVVRVYEGVDTRRLRMVLDALRA
jgi:transposase